MTNEEIYNRRMYFMNGLAKWALKNGYSLLAAAGDTLDSKGDFSFCLRNTQDKTELSDITANLANAVEAAYAALMTECGLSSDAAKDLIHYFVESGIENGEHAIGSSNLDISAAE